MAGRGTSDVEQLKELSSQARAREATAFLLSRLGPKSWAEFYPGEMALLDAFCEHVLGGLLKREVTWLIRNPTLLARLTGLLEEVARVQYLAAASVEHLARLRCLLAMAEAAQGRLEEAHQHLCSSVGREPAEVRRPNGRLREEVAALGTPGPAAAEFLRGFFQAYFAFLRRIGEHDLANVLKSSAVELTRRVEEEERRPGVVRALFYNHREGRGYMRLIHASVTPSEEPEGELRYLPFGAETLEPSILRASEVAWSAVHFHLRTHGRPDGLHYRLVRWQLTTAAGDPIGTRRYQGASIGLPLALAILSSYLDQPVPCHVALTGALDPWATEEGLVAAVDGVREKIAAALQTGSRKVYIPAANADDLFADLALENRARKAGCTVVPVDRLADACQETFNDERDGTFADTLGDAWRYLASFFAAVRDGSRPFMLQRYWWHVLFSAVLFAALFFLEGWTVQLGLSGREATLGAGALIVLAAFLPFGALLWSYALACAGLRNRKRWPWLLSAVAIAVGAAASLLALSPLMPPSTDISAAVNAIPLFGVAKDLFFFWLFGWALLADTFCAVEALACLARRGQFVTLRRSLRWNSPLEAGLPIRCVVFPWEWGALAALVVAVVLGLLEVRYFFSLRADVAHAGWAVGLLMSRDLVFLAAATECLVFYKLGLADIRRALQ